MSELWEIVKYGQVKAGDLIKHTAGELPLRVLKVEVENEARGFLKVTTAFDCELQNSGQAKEYRLPRIDGEVVFRRFQEATQ